MTTFYEFFERTLSGLSMDIKRSIERQLDDLFNIFPSLTMEEINVEMECRFKNVSPEKLVGPLITELERRRGLVKQKKTITDLNYSVDRYQGKFFTVRDSSEGTSPGTFYTKMKVFVPKRSGIDIFEDMGLKVSFSFEITSEEVSRTLLAYAGEKNTPLKRVKNRESYLDSQSGISFDITQVLTVNTDRRDTEIEIDKTQSAVSFLKEDPFTSIKNFISFCEEQARVAVFRTRTLLSKGKLEEAIFKINSNLDVSNPGNFRVDYRIPQVRNIQVEDLLKERFKGYAVTPKADGYRYFLVILSDVIILIQPPNVYKVLYEGPGIPNSWVGFIFDGEYIERENWREENLNKNFTEGVDNYYCIFDVVGYPESSDFFSSDEKLDIIKRINRLKTFFEEVRRQTTIGIFRWSNNFNAIYFQPPMVTRVRTPAMKTFFEIKPYDDAISTPWYASDAFFETLLPKLKYKDDGLILTPVNNSYVQLNENMTLKWKPSDLMSIDFKYVEGDLFVRQDREEVPFRGTKIFPIDRDDIIIENPNNVRLSDGQIYEFIFDVKRRRFLVTRPRFDKVVPNSFKAAAQAWVDTHRPVTAALIRGIGRDGLVETQREGLWSWLENILSNSKGPICDMSNIRPLYDVPVRYLESQKFFSLFSSIPIYRISPQEPIDFPLVNKLPDNINNVPRFEFLILNGQQMMLLEGREDIIVGNDTMITQEYISLLKALVVKSDNVFVRNLPSIVDGVSPSSFIVESVACGNEEELILKRISESCVKIHFKLGGVFHDFTTDSYESVITTQAFKRVFDDRCKVIPAGHRLRDDLQDGGPELILGGKHFGLLWDYVFNALVPSSYFSHLLQPTLKRVTPEEDPLTALIEQVEKIQIETVELPRETPKVDFETLFGTVGMYKVSNNIKLFRESRNSPEAGDLFDIISKAVMIIETQTPPLNAVVYDPTLVSKRANDLRIIFGGITDPEMVVRGIYEKMNMGIVFVRSIKNTDDIDSYYSVFLRPEEFNSPQNGFIIVEARLESEDLLSSCSLITYQNRVLIHHSDPLLAILNRQPLTPMNLTKLNSKLSPLNTGKIKVGSTSWNSLHRLFNSLRFVYPNAPEINREYISLILKETTDNKADYLISMEVPKRFRKQTWGVALINTIEEYQARGVRPDPRFEDRAEMEFSKILDSFTDKSRRELLETGTMFLFDEAYPNNLYGRGLMKYRTQLQLK